MLMMAVGAKLAHFSHFLFLKNKQLFGWIGCDNGGRGIGSNEQLEILTMNDKVIDDDCYCDCDDNNNREIFLHCKHPELLLLKIGNLNQIPNTHL